MYVHICLYKLCTDIYTCICTCTISRLLLINLYEPVNQGKYQGKAETSLRKTTCPADATPPS